MNENTEKLEDLQARAEKIQAETLPTSYTSTTYSRDYSTQPATKGEVVGFSIVAAIMAGVVGLAIWSGIKEEQKTIERNKKAIEERKRKEAEYEEWVENERRNGNIVCVLRNGDRLSISAEAYKQATIRPR